MSLPGIPRQFIDGFYCDRRGKLGFDFIQHIRIVDYDYIRSEDADLLGNPALENAFKRFSNFLGVDMMEEKNWKNKILAK